MTRKTPEITVDQPSNQPYPMEDPLRLLPRIITKLYSIWVSLTYPFASRARNLSIHYTCDLSRLKAHRIKLGSSVRIQKDVLIDVAAPPQRNGEPIVVIEENVGIDQCCKISAKNCIHLERDIIIAQSTLISDHSPPCEDGTQSMSEQGASEGGRIRIGQGSWIGRGAAIICTGGELVLGRNCVVAANALVTRSFPPYSVIIGNPGIIIRQFNPTTNKWVLGSIRPAGDETLNQSTKDQAGRVGRGEPHNASSRESQITPETTGNAVVQPPDQFSPMLDPLRLFSRILTKLYSIWVSLTYPFASRARNLSIHYTCDLSRLKAHRIKLGSSVRIQKDVLIDVAAPPQRNGEPIVVIEENVGIDQCCKISAKNCIHLERDIIIAQSTLISDHSPPCEDGTQSMSEQGASEGGRIRIGQGSWIGRGAAIICTGGELVLGRNCVVAANALVTRSFPPYSVIIGNPAGVIRRFDPDKNAWVIGSGRSTQTPDTSK